MPKYTIQTPDGTFDIDSASELSDAQAYAAATQHGGQAPRQPDGQVSASEPSTYWGGFWNGLKSYAKDLVTDPRTMGMVGAGAAAALVPATGGASALAIPFLGAAAGAGTAIAGRQMRTGRPEDALDTVETMGKEGAINGVLANVPGAARFAAPRLLARADRLAAVPFLQRHAPAAAAGAMLHSPALAAAIEVAQSPMANRAAGRAANFIGNEVPDAAASLGRRFMGAAEEAPLVVDRYMANESGAPRPRLSREVPGFSMDAPAAPAAAAPAEEMPASLQSLIENDRYAPNQPGYQRRTWGDVDNVNGDPNAAARPFSDGVDRYMPNRSSGAPAAAADELPMPRSAQAEVDDLVQRYMPNASDGPQAGVNHFDDLLRSSDAELAASLDRHMPNASAGRPQPGADHFDDLLRSSDAELADVVDPHMPNASAGQQRPGVDSFDELLRSSDAEAAAVVDRYAPNASGYQPGAASAAEPFDPLPMPEDAILRGHSAFEDVMAREPIAAPDRGARAVAGAGNPPHLEQPFQPDMFTGPQGDDSLAALERAAAPRGVTPTPDRLDAAMQGVTDSLPVDANGMRVYNPVGNHVANIEDLPIMRAGADDPFAALERNAGGRPAPDLSIDMNDPALQDFTFEGAAEPVSVAGTPRVDGMRANARRVEDVKSALVNLGYAPRQAAEVATAAAQSTTTTDEAIRAALRQLSPARR